MKNLVIFLVLGFSLVQAQTWTIQTASFHDFRLAQRSLDRLISAGFDAYNEFFMREGKQFVRIRVGCFGNRETAENFLDIMNSMGQINPYIASNSNTESDCINRDIGFITPERWGTYRLNKENIVFWVRIADTTAFISHNNLDWQISQTGRDLLPNAIQIRYTINYFVQDSKTGPVYVTVPNQKPYKLTTGQLLWQSGTVAVILENDMVVSYKLSLGSN